MEEARLLRCEFWTEYGAAGADVRRLGATTGDLVVGELEWEDDIDGDVTFIVGCWGAAGMYCWSGICADGNKY